MAWIDIGESEMDSMTMIVAAVVVMASIAAALFKRTGLGSFRRIVTSEGPQDEATRLVTGRRCRPRVRSGDCHEPLRKLQVRRTIRAEAVEIEPDAFQVTRPARR
jgi:hypothetical protein